jgi:hypothetical protein
MRIIIARSSHFIGYLFQLFTRSYCTTLRKTIMKQAM